MSGFLVCHGEFFLNKPLDQREVWGVLRFPWPGVGGSGHEGCPERRGGVRKRQGQGFRSAIALGISSTKKRGEEGVP